MGRCRIPQTASPSEDDSLFWPQALRVWPAGAVGETARAEGSLPGPEGAEVVDAVGGGGFCDVVSLLCAGVEEVDVGDGLVGGRAGACVGVLVCAGEVSEEEEGV